MKRVFLLVLTLTSLHSLCAQNNQEDTILVSSKLISQDTSKSKWDQYLELMNRAEYLDSISDYTNAIQVYNRVIKIYPNMSGPYWMRGNSKANLEDHRGAILDYTIAIELTPSYVEAYINRGESLLHLKAYKEAIADFDVVIENFSFINLTDIYLKRGIAKIAIGNINGGCLDLSKSGELGNKSAYDIIKKSCN